MYKHKEDRRAYVKKWREKRKLIGFYGKCRICKENLVVMRGGVAKTQMEYVLNVIEDQYIKIIEGVP